jgi:glycosyltransferase involved in cell wall biosynthesis
MRIAWIGLAPTEDSGTSYVGTLLLTELAGLGVDCEAFFAVAETSLHPRLRASSELRLFCAPSGWQPHRWYNRTPLAHHLSLQLTRVRTQRRLAEMIARRHAEHPYDLLVQFSQIELFNIRRLRHRLPPIVIHANAHAAGELRWHRRERHLARKGESLPRFLTVEAMLMTRVAMQRRDVGLAEAVIGPSARYREHLCRDYDVPPERVEVVPDPIDLERFHPAENHERSSPLRLLFVSRIAVRKGVEMVVDLSHRLADLEGQVHIEIVGFQDTWSDYRHLLVDLNPKLATFMGPLGSSQLAERYREADAIVQPSRYEPFPLAVGEALASGLPVVASSEIGAAQGVDPRCCTVFPAGDAAAFESATRELIARLAAGEGQTIATIARAEAERRFAPRTVATQFLEVLERTADTTRAPRSGR